MLVTLFCASRAFQVEQHGSRTALLKERKNVDNTTNNSDDGLSN